MSKRILCLVLCLAAVLLLSFAAQATDAPTLAVDGAGVVTCSAGEGNALYLASYDPANGQFRGLLQSGAKLTESRALKAIQTDGQSRPVSEASSALVIAAGGTYTGGAFAAYDQVVILSGVTDAVTLKDLTVGDLTLLSDCDLTLDGVSVTGELHVNPGGDGAAAQRLPGIASVQSQTEPNLPSVYIRNKSGVGSIRIVQTADGGIRIRTEEGCRVDWVLVDDGKGDILLNGDFNQVVVDTDQNAAVALENGKVSGLTINGQNADVTLRGESSVVSVKIAEEAAGATLAVEEHAEAANVRSEAADVTISGEGTVLRAEVSGDGTSVDTLGTWLSVAEGTAGVSENDRAVSGGAEIKTGTVAEGGSNGQHWEPEAHTHVWFEGVCEEATETQSGAVISVCTVCGITRETVTSFKPYQVTLGEGEEAEQFRFATLEEAIDFAGQTLIEEKLVSEDEDSVVVLYYPEIELVGSAAVETLSLPKGIVLALGDGGHLTVLSGMEMGSARWETENRIYNIGQLFVELSAEQTCSLTLGDQLIYDSADLESSAIVMETDPGIETEGHQHYICFGGGVPEDERDAISPELVLSGNEGATCFRIQKDLDLTPFTQGMRTDGADEGEQGSVIVVAATVKVGHVEVWGAEGTGCFLLNGGSLITDDLSLGFSEACDIQIVPPEGKHPVAYVQDAWRYGIVGGNVVLRGEQDWLRGDLNAAEGEEIPLSVTIAEGAKITLQEDQGQFFPEGWTLTNEGTLVLRGELHLRTGSTLINDGTVLLEAYRGESDDPDAREEDLHRFGRLVLDGAMMENLGTLQLDCIEFLNSNGEDDSRYAELFIENNAYLMNGKDGLLVCKGSIFAENGATLDNNGLLKLEGDCSFLEMKPGDELWIILGDAEPEQEHGNQSCTLVNFGVLEAEGQLRLEGAAVDNYGTITTKNWLELREAEDTKRTVTLTKRSGWPENGDEWELFWYGIPDEDAWWGEDRSQEQSEVRGSIPASFHNLDDGKLINEGQARFENVQLTNRGTFTNGSLTGVGEGQSGSNAWMEQNGGSFENSGAVTNNGSANFNDVDYSQTADAKFTNYNAAGFEVRGGSLTIPTGSWFRNEGYMKLVDRYGEDYEPVDLSGFADFYTGWNREGNDSHWCDVAAEVYDFAGYLEAVDVQQTRAAQNPGTCYNRLDFCGDITITEDVRFEDFGDYWLQTRGEDRWQVWNEDQGRWVDADEETEGAERRWVELGIRMTVAEDATLTIAPGNSLRVDGWEEQRAVFSPNLLEIKGKLVLEPEQQGTEENDWDWREEGFIEIWSFGSFDASAGSVENHGRFEIRYPETGHGTGAGESFQFVYDGGFARPEECPVTGAPDNAVYAAEVRSSQGFVNAAAYTDPAFCRIYLREDTVVTVTENLTVAPAINVEPGSGFIVEHGAAVTLQEHLWDDGDVSVYGDLIIAGSADINQHLEIGAMTGSEEARLIIEGHFAARNNWECETLTVYPTGSIVLREDCEFHNDLAENGPEHYLPVTLQGTPRIVRGAVISESLKLYGERQFDYCLFEAPQVLYALEGTSIGFWTCEFREDVLLDVQDGSERLMVNFGGNSVLAEGKAVRAIHSDTVDLEKMLGESMLDIGGAAGLVIESDVSAWINPGWLELEQGESASYVVNGVTVTHTLLDGRAIGGGINLRYEPMDNASLEEDTLWRVFQADSWSEDGDTLISLSGKLEGYDELRLMQGNLDISALDTGDTFIHISDMWTDTRVNIGGKSVTLSENDPTNEGGNHGFCVIAAEGAEIRVENALMLWDYDRNDYGYSTAVEVRIGEKTYHLNPHIFGTIADRTPAVYIGLDDPEIQYTLIYQGEELHFETEYIEEEHKTHLNPVEGEPWFEASRDTDPGLTLILELPGGVKVTFDRVPVKPEWNE